MEKNTEELGLKSGGIIKKRSKVRLILPQVLATIAFGMLLFTVSAINAMPTVVLGALYKTNETDIHLTDQQASWVGSILFIVHPLGAVGSGFVQDTFGRRRCMMGVTIPMFLGWVLLYFATTVPHLYCVAVIMGLSVGFMEAPAKSFLGEVSEPQYRGTLISIAENFLLFGLLFEFFLAATLYWRYVCIVSAVIPGLVFAIVFMMPESPTWLVVKGRLSEAERNLRWFRGWVTSQEVAEEFNVLIDHVKRSPISEAPKDLVLTEGERRHKRRTGLGKLLLLKEGRLLRPLLLVVLFFLSAHSTGLLGLRPFLVSIFTELKVSLPPSWTLVIAGSVQTCGGLLCAVLIRRTGKRKLAFTSVGMTTLACLLIGVYDLVGRELPWIPTFLFCYCFFFAGLGAVPLPWILVSEIFPLEVRGLGAGLSSALSYVLVFLVTKFYTDLGEPYLRLGGTVIVYGVIGILCLIFLYYRLPETEGKSLVEVERIFDKGRSSVRAPTS